ncbi:MAG: UDP-N-acetylglucosamine 4,6-dehydratase family protein [Dehalococcoidia bacterium]|jgi:UDP-N-acetylglucosamine 4,6-dehydratase
MVNIFRGKNILVSGGSGSIGSEIVKKLLQYEPKVVRVLSNDENCLFNLEQELQGYSNLRFLAGDVRDKERLQHAVEDIDFVFHAAALKHVPLCEYNPFEAVKTNVLGTQNVIETAMEEEVEKLITISTDKAVNPVNVMGATKLLAERLTISANYYKGLRETAFSCVRFGNVLDSRGSVVPLFQTQIEKGGPVTLTEPNMTRFVMSIPKAVELVLKAAEIAQGGEIFIFKMPAFRIGDLAKAMIEELAPQYGYNPESIKVEITGKRAGEKMYEELLTADEAMNASETEDMFIITPAAKNQESKRISAKEYRSDQDGILLATEEIKEILRKSLPQPL